MSQPPDRDRPKLHAAEGHRAPEVLRVSADDQRRLVDALSDPAPPTSALRRAIKLSNKLIG